MAGYRGSQVETAPVAFADVPSFVASVQQRHDSMLEGTDTSTAEGRSMQVVPTDSVLLYV